MSLSVIDPKRLKQMILHATAVLDAGKDTVNALNVFPVPDGDTGSNMSMTMNSAAREVDKTPARSCGQVAAALAQGSLMGARGNSGVILSQLFRGFARSMEGKTELAARDLADAFDDAVATAYKAVMKPVEGTILTVAKDSARAAGQAARRATDVLKVLQAAVLEAEASLARTPELLPVLKKAGVVDSGGKGLSLILRGFFEAAADGALLPVAESAPEPVAEMVEHTAGRGRDTSPATKIDFALDAEISDIRYPYDTEFLIRGTNIPVDVIRTRLEQLGDCVIVVGTPSLTKVHIHTDNPGPVLDFCVPHGDLIQIELKNMREQHADLKEHALHAAPEAQAAAHVAVEPQALAPTGVVAVAAGEGLEEIFNSLGAARVVTGGQTMNPSTQELLEAIASCPAAEVFVLPNNKNIILAAEQAARLSTKPVHVIPSRSVPQGISALVAWTPEAEPAKLTTAMNRALGDVQTGEITYSVRDTVFGDLEIHERDILGLVNGQIQLTGQTPEAVLKELLAGMMAQQPGDVISLYWGEGIDAARAEELAEELQQLYPETEVECRYGGQPLYYYIFSVE